MRNYMLPVRSAVQVVKRTPPVEQPKPVVEVVEATQPPPEPIVDTGPKSLVLTINDGVGMADFLG